MAPPETYISLFVSCKECGIHIDGIELGLLPWRYSLRRNHRIGIQRLGQLGPGWSRLRSSWWLQVCSWWIAIFSCSSQILLLMSSLLYVGCKLWKVRDFDVGCSLLGFIGKRDRLWLCWRLEDDSVCPSNVKEESSNLIFTKVRVKTRSQLTFRSKHHHKTSATQF